MKKTANILLLMALAALFAACKNDKNEPINYNIVEDVQSYFDMTKHQMRRSLRRNYGTVRESSNTLRGRSRTQMLTIHFDDDGPYRIDYQRDDVLKSLNEMAAVAQRFAFDVHTFYIEYSAPYNYGSMSRNDAELLRSDDHMAFADSLVQRAGTYDCAEERYDTLPDPIRRWRTVFHSTSNNRFQFTLAKR